MLTWAILVGCRQSLRRAAFRAIRSSTAVTASPSTRSAPIWVAAVRASVLANTQQARALSITTVFREESGEQQPAESNNTASRPAQRVIDATGTRTQYALFIANYPSQAGALDLQDLFAKYGNVTGVVVYEKGHSFVFFETPEEAGAGLDAEGLIWHGRRLKVQLRKATPKYEGQAARPVQLPSKTIYIGRIPTDATDEDLNGLFRPLQDVRDVRVAMDSDSGSLRGFAHAEFYSIEAAEKAKEQLAGHTIKGQELALRWAGPARPRQNRRPQESEQENKIREDLAADEGVSAPKGQEQVPRGIDWNA